MIEFGQNIKTKEEGAKLMRELHQAQINNVDWMQALTQAKKDLEEIISE